MSDASVGLDDLFQNTELTKFRERNVTSYLLNLRVFPLGTFYVFFSTCNTPPCLLEQDGVVLAGTYRMPVVIEFSNAGTRYGELGSSIMHTANYSFSHEDPHDLAILVLDPGQNSEYNDDPLTMSFPDVDFTNLTFVGMASYAYVNWTIDNSESFPHTLSSVSLSFAFRCCRSAGRRRRSFAFQCHLSLHGKCTVWQIL